MALTSENTSRTVRANGVIVQYHEAGDGPALICVPPTAFGATAWSQNRHNIEALSQHFRTLLVNLPPQGGSDKTLTHDGPRTPFFAAILRDFMDAVGVERAHLYGGSPGAGVVLRFAMLYPERVAKLVLDSPTGMGQSLFMSLPTEGNKVVRRFAQEPTMERVAEMMEAQVSRPELRTEDLMRLRFDAAREPGYREASERITGPMEDLAPELPNVHAPALVIWGAADRDIPMDQGLKLLWRMPDARLHVFGAGTGHWPQYERAAEWNQLVIDFLKG